MKPTFVIYRPEMRIGGKGAGMPQPRSGSVPAAFGWMLVLSIVSGIFLPALGIISGLSIAVVIVLNILALLAGAIVGALA